MKRFLQTLAPYIAVAIFWCVFKSAWLSILAYHAQILFWSWRRLGLLRRGWDLRMFLVAAVPCLLAGPLAYALIPHVTADAGLKEWLAGYGLNGLWWIAMVPYFGLIHPLLEQVHWSGLRSAGWPAHLAYAGYHGIVLFLLLQPLWLCVCLGILLVVSAVWSRIQEKCRGGLLVVACGHVFADLGIVAVAWIAAM